MPFSSSELYSIAAALQEPQKETVALYAQYMRDPPANGKLHQQFLTSLRKVNKSVEAHIDAIAEASGNSKHALRSVFGPEINQGRGLSHYFWLHTHRPADMVRTVAQYGSFNVHRWISQGWKGWDAGGGAPEMRKHTLFIPPRLDLLGPGSRVNVEAVAGACGDALASYRADQSKWNRVAEMRARSLEEQANGHYWETVWAAPGFHAAVRDQMEYLLSPTQIAVDIPVMPAPAPVPASPAPDAAPPRPSFSPRL